MNVLPCSPSYRLICLASLTSCLLCFLFRASSITVGVLLWFVVNLYSIHTFFSAKVCARKIFLRLYRTEFVKLLSVGTLLILVDRLFSVNILEILFGYLITQALFFCLWIGWDCYG
jgi:hypothetical protein